MDIVRHLFAFPVEVWRKWTGALPVVPSRAACAATTPPDRLLAPAATETMAGEHQSIERRAKRRCIEALPVGVARWWVQHAQQQAVARLYRDLLNSQRAFPHHGVARFASFPAGDATATSASASSVVAAVAGCVDHWHSCTEKFHTAPRLQRTPCAPVSYASSFLASFFDGRLHLPHSPPRPDSRDRRGLNDSNPQMQLPGGAASRSARKLPL